MTLRLKTRTEKGRMGGYIGRVFCQMHNGQWLWSDSCRVERVTRADAKADAESLLQQHKSQIASVEL